MSACYFKHCSVLHLCAILVCLCVRRTILQQDAEVKEDVRKMKKKLQDKLRRIKKNQEKGIYKKPKKEKQKPDTTLKVCIYELLIFLLV